MPKFIVTAYSASTKLSISLARQPFSPFSEIGWLAGLVIHIDDNESLHLPATPQKL